MWLALDAAWERPRLRDNVRAYPARLYSIPKSRLPTHRQRKPLWEVAEKESSQIASAQPIGTFRRHGGSVRGGDLSVRAWTWLHILTCLLPVADAIFNLLDRVECLATYPLVVAKGAQSLKVVCAPKLPNHLKGKRCNLRQIVLEPVLLI